MQFQNSFSNSAFFTLDSRSPGAQGHQHQPPGIAHPRAKSRTTGAHTAPTARRPPPRRRGTGEFRLSASAAIDRGPLDPATARARALARDAAAAGHRVGGGSERVWELFPAADRGLESPAARLARLAAEVAMLERDAAAAAR